MIEWMPIKDWKFKRGDAFLVFLQGKKFKKPTEIAQACVLYREAYPISVSAYGEFDTDGKPVSEGYSEGYEFHITHIAPINMPVEKTLEEKLSDYWINTPNMLNLELIEQFARIAKEHYEGEK
jgi:hypothetical protein